MQSKSRLQTHHQRSDLEHLKSHTSFGTQTPQTSDSALTYQYLEIQEIQKGLHLMKIKSKDYSNPIPLL